MNAKMLTPSKYFSAADFEGEVTVTIKAVRLEEIEVEAKGGKPAGTEVKGSIELAEYPKAWISNVTNTKCLVAMFGDENIETRWVGKRVTLYIDRVMSFGEWTPGVRIKGSPDIDKPISLRLKLRKKKDQTLTMQRTGAATSNGHSNGNGHAKPPAPKPAAPAGIVQFGLKEGWKGHPIQEFTSAQLDDIAKHGEEMCSREPSAAWVKGVLANVAEIRADLERRVHAEPPPVTPPEVEAP
jgi:hypothetical protein